MGCHKNSKTGDYHCHRGNNSSTKSKIPNKSKLTNEAAFNRALALLLNGRTEVSLPYNYGNSGNTTLTASVRIDIMTNKYVIEGGLDKGVVWTAFSRPFLLQLYRVKSQL